MLDDVKLNILREWPFPKLDVFPYVVAFDQLEKEILNWSIVSIDRNIERGCQNMAVDWDRCVNAVVIFIKDNRQKLSKTFQSYFVAYLEQSFNTELVQQMDKQLLSLFVPHNLPEFT